MTMLKKRMVIKKKMNSSNDKDAYDTQMSPHSALRASVSLVLSTIFSDHWSSCSHQHTNGRVRIARVRDVSGVV